jgi:hypothetical protein
MDTAFGIERGTPIRMPSNSLLTIASSDRYKNINDYNEQPSTPFDFSIQKRENIMAGSITRIALTEFNLPWAIPNINLKTNQINFTFTLTGAPPTTTVTITVPEGFYTGEALASALQTLILNAVPALVGSFSLIYRPDGAFFAETTNPNDLFQFDYVQKPEYFGRKGLYNLMGWQKSNIILANSQLSGFATMIPSKFVDVVSEQITYNQDLRDSASQPIVRDILARIYLAPNIIQNFRASDQQTIDLSGNPTGIISQTYPNILGTSPFNVYKDFSTPKYIKWSGNQNVPGYIKFTLYDDEGFVLSANSLLFPDDKQPDWCLTLLASET